jgi:hypothetical protein
MEKNMKRLIAVFAVVVLWLAVPASAVPTGPSLGWWNEGDPCTTHQLWDFTPSHVANNPGDGYTAIPEEVISPHPGAVVATISPGGTYNGDTNSFTAQRYLYVSLELPNINVLNPCKIIWVDIGDVVIYLEDIGITAIGHDIPSTEYNCEFLPAQGDAEFGVIIRPNPEIEKITMYFEPGTVLDYIHVDTICVPESATVALLGLGTLSLLRRKRSA